MKSTIIALLLTILIVGILPLGIGFLTNPTDTMGFAWITGFGILLLIISIILLVAGVFYLIKSSLE